MPLFTANPDTITIPTKSPLSQGNRKKALINKGKILDINTPGKLIENTDKNLYNASSKDMYPLLEALRTLPDIKDCYTFGATLHIVTNDSFNPDNTISQLRQRGLKDVNIWPANGNIEDLFIKLAKNDG